MNYAIARCFYDERFARASRKNVDCVNRANKDTKFAKIISKQTEIFAGKYLFFGLSSLRVLKNLKFLMIMRHACVI